MVRDQGVGGLNLLSPTILLKIKQLRDMKNWKTPRARTRKSDFVKSRSHHY